MRKLIYKILLLTNALFAFALLLSYLAVHISPEVFALPAFFGLAYPYLLLINLVFSLIWIVLLRFEALISIIVIAIGFTHLTNYLRIGKHSGDLKGTFKVMSYNVMLFNNIGKQNISSEQTVLAFLNKQQPDILMLQEFYFTGNPEKEDLEVRTALGGKYYSHFKISGNGRNRFYGIVTYSRYPITGKGEIKHAGSSSLSIYTDIVIQKDTFRIFNNHLQSFRLKNMERSFLEELAAPEDKESLGELKDISISLKKAFVRRALQAETVKKMIDSSPYPVIVAGDFNDTPVSYSYRKIRKGLNDAFVSSGYGAGFTYKGNYPPNRIDYILYDNSLESMNFEITKVRYSDHYPITAYLKKRD